MSHIYQLLRRPISGDRYLPEVDGIRFLAISLVVLQHIRSVFDYYWFGQQAGGPPYLLSLATTNGYNGVRIFFALSGFILSLPFVPRASRADRPVSLGRYYKRRLVRLEPPYIIALTLAFIWQVARGHFSWADGLPHYIASCCYLHNLLYDGPPLINGVTWSLEIELQFYLVAPLLFRIFRLPPARRRVLLVVLILLLIGLHQCYWPARQSLYQYLQLFLTGMLVADFQVSGWPAFVRQRWLGWLILPALWLVIRNPAVYTFPVELLLCAALFLSFGLMLSQDRLRRLCALRWLAVTGGMCYSIYLVHYPLLQGISRLYRQLFLTRSYTLSFLYCALPSLGSVLLVSVAFYLAIERPFMNRRPAGVP